MNERIRKSLSTANDPLLSGKEVEQLSGGVLPESTTRYWRCVDRHTKELPWIKIGKKVFYRQSAVEKFLRGGAAA